MKTSATFSVQALCFFYLCSALAFGETVRPLVIPGSQGGVVSDDLPEFTWPNEFRAGEWGEALRGRKGTYLGVGTFRTLHGFAMGDFERAVFVDINPQITTVNAALITLLAKAESRGEFLEVLTGETYTPQRLEILDHGEDSVDDIEKAAPKSRRAAKTLAELPAATRKVFRLFQESGSEKINDLRRKYGAGEWAHTVFGSDAVYERVHRAAGENRFTAITADLAQKEQMLPLVRELKSVGTKVSVVDTSNAISWIFKSQSGVESFADTVDSLPLARDAKLLFTSPTSIETTGKRRKLGRAFARGRGHGFHYYDAPWKAARGAMLAVSVDADRGERWKEFLESLPKDTRNSKTYERQTRCEIGLSRLASGAD